MTLRARRPLLALGCGALLLPLLSVYGGSPALGSPRASHRVPGIARDAATKVVEGEGPAYQAARDAYFTDRITPGDTPLTPGQAAKARNQAAKDARKGKKGPGTPGPAIGGSWTPVGPSPTVQLGRTSLTPESVAGRVTSLAVDPSGRTYLGAAQGGVWARDPGATSWTPLTDGLPTLSVGAVAVAPSDSNVVYLATGEGSLAGDSYSGDGFWRSNDKGASWSHVSGDTFTGMSVARLAIDPLHADHVYAAVLTGVSGSRAIRSTPNVPVGLYETSDGGITWTLRHGGTDRHQSAFDVRVDPLDANTVYAAFRNEGLLKSTDHGLHWAAAMTGLPAIDWSADVTRMALGISHPTAAVPARLYTGFEWVTADGAHHDAQVFSSTDGAAHWNATPTGAAGSVDSILGYCGIQCDYDNVIEVDPSNPDIVYVGGLYQYGLSSGGIYRSMDGGLTWKSLGFDLHPDFHALALQPGNPSQVYLGNDGGVWGSPDRGGRLTPDKTLADSDWENLNDGLQITQFTSLATVPDAQGVLWGGTQDNGTQITFGGGDPTFYDVGAGDGGQVLVDPNDDRYVYGTHYGIDPFRVDTFNNLNLSSYDAIPNGLNLKDRSEFYVPWVMNKGNANQLLLGTYRVYRTDNAKAAKPSDVLWKPISGDLTSGCTGRAPNGGSGCVISAVGTADGGAGAYAGAVDGSVSASPNALTSDAPTWKRVGAGSLPLRPVTQFAVDRSNWRIAYVSFAGFNSATPKRPGHVFGTTDGGASWTDLSAQLPDAPVNSVVLDPADARTLYVGTDVGMFVSHDAGSTWSVLGTDVPRNAVWQLDEDSTHGVLAAGTYGRGAWTLPTGITKPALVLQPSDSGLPVGPGSTLTYQLAVHNIGNAAATGVAVSLPLPDETTFSSASDSGSEKKGLVTWSGLAVPAGGSKVITLAVHLSDTLKSKTTTVVLDGETVTSAEGASTTGSPYSKAISPPHAVSLVPAAQTDGGRTGTSVSYPVTVQNLGYLPDTFAVTATGSWTTAVFNAACSAPTADSGVLAPGASATLCLKVAVPAGTADGTTVHTAVSAVSKADSSVSGTAGLDTIAVAIDTLFVDQDGNNPDTSAFYASALTANGITFATWDLTAKPDLPAGYIAAHRTVVWGTGNSYPAPITRYEPALTRLLQGGGRLLLSGQDILDQSAGTTDFVRNYLHVDWDGTDAQNDRQTAFVVGQSGDPVASGLGQVILDHSVLGAAYEDRVTPLAPASAAFSDDAGLTDGLSVAAGGYKIVFLAFPFEAYGTPAQRTALIARATSWFAS